MPALPPTEKALLLRTDFHDEISWVELCHAAQATSAEGFSAQIDCVSDPRFADVSVDDLVKQSAKSGDRSFCFLADHQTLTDPQHPVLVLDLQEEPGRRFRVIPSELWSVENNLSLANMDFHDFANSADPDGVFRGFR
ncbi:MAG TPA: hypothetical protein DDY91_13135 [Planctomycetaceae bacterium]|nr:hypothetical protein [Planctomycetaceae bacterium]